MDFFKKQKTAAEAAKDTKKAVRSSTRDIEKEIRQLDRQEKEVLTSIKKRGKEASGPEDKVLRTLATQLVQVRNQRAKMVGAKAHLSSMGMKASAMKSSVAMADAMKNVGKAMGEANKAVDSKKMAKTLQEFQIESEKMAMTEDLMDDALMDAFDGDGVEEEADDVTNQVLAELGLQLDASMADAPTQKLPAAKSVAEEEGDKWMDDLPDLKERLKAL